MNQHRAPANSETSPATRPQTNRTYGFLGPIGTFTQAALQRWDAPATATATAFATVQSSLAAVRSREIDCAVVPIENSIEGGVSSTLDALNAAEPLRIIGEVLVPINFVLCAPAGTSREDVQAIGSHSHAWPQVRGWVNRNLPQAAYVPTLSTAAAARDLSQGTAANYQAAVCAPMAAEAYNLEVLADHIADNRGAVTRFVVVASARDAAGVSTTPPCTGRDKTTLVLYQRRDRAGGLLDLLEHFAARGINMTRLESRPTGEAMGAYSFSIDIEGHIAQERVAEALKGLHRVAGVRYLGSYARADQQENSVNERATDEAFVEAQEWLSQQM